jgi:hypothetical protein
MMASSLAEKHAPRRTLARLLQEPTTRENVEDLPGQKEKKMWKNTKTQNPMNISKHFQTIQISRQVSRTGLRSLCPTCSKQ